MYFFYFDESGARDPEVTGTRKDGTTFAKEHLYVLTAIKLDGLKVFPDDSDLVEFAAQGYRDFLQQTQNRKPTGEGG